MNLPIVQIVMAKLEGQEGAEAWAWVCAAGATLVDEC